MLFLGIVTQPPPRETFTILHFTDPMLVQREVKVNEAFDVNFTVINNEYTDNEYKYEIFVKEKKVSEGSLFLSHNNTKEISEEITPIKAENETKISILLYTKGIDKPYRSLHYFLNVTGG